MKRCPTCNKTYSDDSMSFCLEDGAPLLTVGGSEAPPPSFDPNLTIPYTPPRDTTEPQSGAFNPPSGAGGGGGWGAPSGPASGQFGQQGQQPGGGSQYGQQGGQYGQPGGPASGQFPPPPQSNQYQPTPNWSPQTPPGYAAAPKKSSALPWILGGVGLLIVLGVVGVVLIGVLASMGSNSNKKNSNNSNSTANKSNRNSNSNSNSNSTNSNNSNSSTASTPSSSDDFSSQKWWTGTVNVGTASYEDGEYRLRANNGGYIVVYAPKTDDYHTENARVRVTTRSVSGDSPSLGYGLAVYGEMKNNQLEDYSFLIRTDASGPAYRVVLHQNGKETVLVNWTTSSLIRTGTSPNQLEVRADGKQLTFYINGQYATSVTDTAGYERGLAGFYTSDAEEVAFDDLEIYK